MRSRRKSKKCMVKHSKNDLVICWNWDWVGYFYVVQSMRIYVIILGNDSCDYGVSWAAVVVLLQFRYLKPTYTHSLIVLNTKLLRVGRSAGSLVIMYLHQDNLQCNLVSVALHQRRSQINMLLFLFKFNLEVLHLS